MPRIQPGCVGCTFASRLRTCLGVRSPSLGWRLSSKESLVCEPTGTETRGSLQRPAVALLRDPCLRFALTRTRLSCSPRLHRTARAFCEPGWHCPLREASGRKGTTMGHTDSERSIKRIVSTEEVAANAERSWFGGTETRFMICCYGYVVKGMNWASSQRATVSCPVK